jgi:hypothetical protein
MGNDAVKSGFLPEKKNNNKLFVIGEIRGLFQQVFPRPEQKSVT